MRRVIWTHLSSVNCKKVARKAWCFLVFHSADPVSLTQYRSNQSSSISNAFPWLCFGSSPSPYPTLLRDMLDHVHSLFSFANSRSLPSKAESALRFACSCCPLQPCRQQQSLHYSCSLPALSLRLLRHLRQSRSNPSGVGHTRSQLWSLLAIT